MNSSPNKQNILRNGTYASIHTLQIPTENYSKKNIFIQLATNKAVSHHRLLYNNPSYRSYFHRFHNAPSLHPEIITTQMQQCPLCPVTHSPNTHTRTHPRGTSVHHHYNCWHPQLNAHRYHLNSTISTTLLTLQSILCFLHDATKNQLLSTDDQPLLPTFINNAFLHAQKHPPKGTLSNKRHNYPQPYQTSINPHYDWQTHPTLRSCTAPHTPLHPTAAHYSALIPNVTDDTNPASRSVG